MLDDFKKMMKEYYDIDNVELTSNFKKDFDLSSIDYVNILCLIEKKYQISIDEDIYRKLNTVGELVGYVESVLKK